MEIIMQETLSNELKIQHQSKNSINICISVYIVEHIDPFNNKIFYIEGKSLSGEQIKLAKYRDKDQARYVLDLILKAEKAFSMPNIDFDEPEDTTFTTE